MRQALVIYVTCDVRGSERIKGFDDGAVVYIFHLCLVKTRSLLLFILTCHRFLLFRSGALSLDQVYSVSMNDSGILCSWHKVEGDSDSETLVFASNNKPCEIMVRSAMGIGGILVLSSARNCEILNRDSYVCTVQGTKLADGVFRLQFDLQVIVKAVWLYAKHNSLSRHYRCVFPPYL